ncbi:hypothetical protein JL2886_00910 [Phaeobacter gallaeciensis]|uniref:Uncharacterized protein n=1 Tax=Phaeobacter gallaeciensis TaxID=60890 RepID=A0A1B0ZP19_9RHOB|nr:hypothetical protein JL2886_00910 [Phaeobacter gallaeciensis]
MRAAAAARLAQRLGPASSMLAQGAGASLRFAGWAPQAD